MHPVPSLWKRRPVSGNTANLSDGQVQGDRITFLSTLQGPEDDASLKNMAARMLESRTALSGIPVLSYHFSCPSIIWDLLIPSFLGPGQEPLLLALFDIGLLGEAESGKF